ncbi:MAG TPA: alpha-galactosidase, partial [Mobilitalea sp.]|nr:alpha-galactosidase [Mobilitalea sp.]
RLVKDYGIGYLKMDYNIEPGIGTEFTADSAGDGLLEHERAYLSWLDNVYMRYPDLVIENCSSGGLRMDYAMLSRYSIQSTSDQEDYRRYATIAANAPAALTPEQAAVWAYPLSHEDKEETVFNMVNALLLRIHLSGQLTELSKERTTLIKEALDYYKMIREDIRSAVPFWPLGLSKYIDPWACLGLITGNKIYLAVWRRNSETDSSILPIPILAGKQVTVTCAYPQYKHCTYEWNTGASSLAVQLPKQYTARLFELDF